ncbi:hypothetical protein BJ546DRAFT_1084974 [Cryomyces antarcticus]
MAARKTSLQKRAIAPMTAAKRKYGTDDAAPGRSISKPTKVAKSMKGVILSEQKEQKTVRWLRTDGLPSPSTGSSSDYRKSPKWPHEGTLLSTGIAGLSAHVPVETVGTARQEHKDSVIECKKPTKPVSKRAPVTKADNTAKHTSGAPRSEGVLLLTPDTEDSEDELKDLQYFPRTSLSTTPAEHVRSDAHFTESLCKLRNAVAAFAIAHFCFTIPEAVQADTLAKIAVTATPELIRYAGFIAVGGPDGRAGWEKMFVQKNERSALAFGLLGHALKEHVFDSLLFGASAEQELALRSFIRTASRAGLINDYLATTPTPPNFTAAAETLTLQLYTLLLPLLALDPAYEPLPSPSTSCLRAWLTFAQGPATTTELSAHHMRLRALHAVVRTTAHLSLRMRRQADVVFYFAPTCKDEAWSNERMECFNAKDMDRLHSSKEARDGPLVRVVCWAGVAAYRRGGGEIAVRELREQQEKEEESSAQGVLAHADRKRKRQPNPQMGFRTKTLTKSVVACRWGRQRKFGGEAEDVDKGFLELRQVVATEKERAGWGCTVM